MSAQRWRVALDGYLVPVGGGREREVYDEGDEVVLAADYERDVAAAEVRGWNAAVEGVISACQADWRFEDHNDWYLAAVAALRKPTEAQT